MKKTVTKTLSLLLALLMLMTAVPTSVFAVEPKDPNCDHNYVSVPAVAATDSKHGNIKYYRCSECKTCFEALAGNKPGNVIEESSTITHKYSEWNPDETSEDDLKLRVSAATCQKKAVYYKKCLVENCGEVSKDTFEFGTTTDHRWSEPYAPDDANCKEASFVIKKKCADCGKVEDVRTVEKGDHVTVDKGDIDPTCTAEGHRAGTYCTNCMKYTQGGEVLAKKPHNIKVIDKGYPATCTEPGLTDHIGCETCDTKEIPATVIPKLNHEGGLIDVKPKAKTCLENGYKMEARICKFCNKVFSPNNTLTSDVVDFAPGNHAYTEVAADKSKLLKKHWECTQMEGLTEYFLRPTKIQKVDGKDVEVDINVNDEEAKNYTLNDGIYVYVQVEAEDVYEQHTHTYKKNEAKSKDNTCELDGVLVEECTVCTKAKTTNLVAKGHDFKAQDGGVWTITKKPTCTAEGTMAQHCNTCKKDFNVTPVPATGHNWKLDDGADCTKGTAKFHCTNEGCNATKEDKISDSKQHVDANNDGFCDVCGKASCSCLCHKDQWYYKTIYYFLRVWWEFLGIRQTCACGKVHYTKIATQQVPTVT